jgi:ABC-type branched-subunit amino acid transport system permease subunit
VCVLTSHRSTARLGSYLAAIRDRDAAESLGIDITLQPDHGALLLPDALGGTFAQYFRYVNPTRLLGVDLIEIARGLIGGWQTVLGPVIGSILLSPTSEIIRGSSAAPMRLHLFLWPRDDAGDPVPPKGLHDR